LLGSDYLVILGVVARVEFPLDGEGLPFMQQEYSFFRDDVNRAAAERSNLGSVPR